MRQATALGQFASAVIYGLIAGQNLAIATECGAALAMTAPGDTSMRGCGKSRI